MRSYALTGLRRLALRDVPSQSRPGQTTCRSGVGTVGVCGGSTLHVLTPTAASVPGGRAAVRVDTVRRHRGVGRPRRPPPAPGDRVAVDPAMPCCLRPVAPRDATTPAATWALPWLPGQAKGALQPRRDAGELLFRRAGRLLAGVGRAGRAGLHRCYAVSLADALRGAQVVHPGLRPHRPERVAGRRAAGAGAHPGHRSTCRRAERAGDALAPTGAARRRPSPTRWSRPAGRRRLRGLRTAGGAGQGRVAARPRRRLLPIGIPTVERVSFPIDLLAPPRNWPIQNVRRQNGCVPAAIELLFGPVGARALRLVTHRFAAARTADAFELGADLRRRRGQGNDRRSPAARGQP